MTYKKRLEELELFMEKSSEGNLKTGVKYLKCGYDQDKDKLFFVTTGS